MRTAIYQMKYFILININKDIYNLKKIIKICYNLGGKNLKTIFFQKR